MILGVARDDTKHRSLTAVGLVERDDTGLVRVVPVWSRAGGFTDRRARLDELIAGRR